jgi:UDP-N-acetylglucosamine transferase subunit ALG13
LIFVALGTHEQPFSRAVRLVSPLAAQHDLVIQHGTTPVDPSLPRTTWVRFTDYDNMRSLVSEADHIVTHAGVGLIMTSLRGGKKPILIARLARFGEHVDDHQLQIAREFSNAGRAVHFEDGDIFQAIKDSSEEPMALGNRRELSNHVWDSLGFDTDQGSAR